jgi:hypothetical protein
MAEVTITVQPPGAAAALALFGAVVAIDIAAIRLKRATISRWVRHQYRRRPAATLAAMALLTAHLLLELESDPAIRFARWMGQGDA